MSTKYRDEKFSTMQRMAISALTDSYNNTVHATLFAEADATKLREYITSDAARDRYAPTLTGILISILGKAVRAMPNFNAVYVDGMRRIYDEVNIGLAVAAIDGTLSVPVIRKVDCLQPPEIDQVRKELARKAQAKKLRQDDFGGAAITLSNIGMYPALRFGTPVIPLGQSALLVTGALHQQCTSGHWILPLSLGFDHRVNNGAPAAEFLQTIADAIEKFSS